MPLQFYYDIRSPPCRAVLMLLRELDQLKYEDKVTDFMQNQHKTEEYLKIHPFGQLPAIKDDDFNLWESRAILVYLASKYGPQCGKPHLYPNSVKDRAMVDQFLYGDFSAYEKILSYMNFLGVFTKGEGPKEEKMDAVKEALKHYEYFASKGKYMAGNNLTIADFSCAASVTTLSVTGYNDWEPYPNLKKWYGEMKKLDYFDECITKPVETLKEMYQGMIGKTQSQQSQ